MVNSAKWLVYEDADLYDLVDATSDADAHATPLFLFAIPKPVNVIEDHAEEVRAELQFRPM